jgi:microcystin-dependent protein
MFKRFIAATLLLACSVLQTFAAGSLSLSLSQQFDSLGRPLSGGKLYFFQTGTSTPQSAFQDTALTLAHPNPLTLDSSGRIPAFYLADGSIKIRLADAAGVTILAYDGLLVIGPSSGAGAAPSVDATTVLAVGDVKSKYGTGALTGFVRMNGRTIGSPTSGATERANADAQTLFEYLWNADANLAVSAGRGASSNADWLANKTIALPDFRGRVPAALDDMGNSAAGRLTSSFFGGTGTTLGASGGAESRTLTTAQLPSHTHSFSATTSTNGAHQHNSMNGDTAASASISVGQTLITWSGFGTGIPAEARLAGSATGADRGLTSSNGDHTHTVSGTSGSAGTDTAHATVQPTMLVTYYIKL